MQSSSLESMPLPPPTQPQGLRSSTYKQPPLDGTLTIAEMADWHAHHSPTHPLFVYPDNDGTKTITWGEAARAFHRSGRVLQSLVGKCSPAHDRPLVAILANSDAITYLAVFAGALRAGIPVFPISTRNSPSAVAHLLSKTQPRHLLVGPEKPYQELAAASLQILLEQNIPQPRLSPMPVFEDLYNDSDKSFTFLPSIKPKLRDMAYILHSSGSTAYPKPIPIDHLRQLCMARTSCYGQLDMTGMTLAPHVLPIFHTMGIFQLGLAAVTGCVLSVFKPQSPAVIPTPENVIQAIVATHANLIFTVPNFIMMWMKHPESVKALKSVHTIYFGGGPLSKETGEHLAAERINVASAYGLTEFGGISRWIIDYFNEDWEYFSFTPEIKVEMVPVGDGNVQLIIPVSGYQYPCVINTKINGIDAYDTSDILTPHPTKPGLWKVFGRADDQIMHSTGEKTNPGPLENILNQDPHVHFSLMFGRGRFNAGVLVDPQPHLRFDPTDEAKLTEFRNLIWPTVEKMNEYAPQHSRVFKEMILITSPDKPFTYTAKGSPRRQAIINDYEPEINSLYEAVDESTQADLTPPSTWNIDTATDFISSVISQVVDIPIGDNDDIFQFGCDSLQATWIRNSLIRALKTTTDVNVRIIPNTFVYLHPTVSSLAAFVCGLVSGGAEGGRTETPEQAMLSMVEKYSQDFPFHRSQGSQPDGRVYVVTGTTGGLGCALLAHLSSQPEVHRIYAINRPGKGNLKDRQLAGLEDRGYDAQQILENGKVVLIDAVTEHPQLGLTPSLYEEISKSITHIIHNAWPVNFNLSLQAFEPSVRSVRHFIDLALSSPYTEPAQLLFTSSIGVLRHVDLSGIISETQVDASVAVGSGYSESKWVAERLLAVASEKTALQTVAVRLGQLSGSETNGAWNHGDWLPSLVKSSAYLRCMPTMNKNVSWISNDAVARSLAEMVDSDASILHLVHPRPVTWPSLMEPLAQLLSLPVVSFDEWVARLERSGEGLSADEEVDVMRQNPALKIIDTFIGGRARIGSSQEAMGMPRLDVAEAQRVSPSLSADRLPQMTVEDALRWVSYWKRINFL